MQNFAILRPSPRCVLLSAYVVVVSPKPFTIFRLKTLLKSQPFCLETVFSTVSHLSKPEICGD